MGKAVGRQAGMINMSLARHLTTDGEALEHANLKQKENGVVVEWL